MNLLKVIYLDYQKYCRYGGNFISILFFTQGFSAIFQYRIAHFFYIHLKLIGCRQLVLALCLLWQKWIEFSCGMSIPASARIGHSFYIGHFGGIILNANTIIGNNCNISQGVTVGISGKGNNRGVPIIGNNVYIGANAVLAGKIEIGDNILIGACSMVNQSFTENAVIIGVPAIKISDKSSNGYI